LAVGGGGTSCWREGYRRACGREAKRAATRMPLGVAGSSRVGRNAPAGVGFYLAQVVAQSGERIGLGGEAENTENRFTNLDDSPTTELRAPTFRSAAGTPTGVPPPLGCPDGWRGRQAVPLYLTLATCDAVSHTRLEERCRVRPWTHTTCNPPLLTNRRPPKGVTPFRAIGHCVLAVGCCWRSG